MNKLSREEWVLACRVAWDNITDDLEIVDEGETLTGWQVQHIVFTSGLGSTDPSYGFTWASMAFEERISILKEAFPNKRYQV